MGAFWQLEGDRVVRSKERQKSNALSLKATHDGLVARALWDQDLGENQTTARDPQSQSQGRRLCPEGHSVLRKLRQAVYGNPNRSHRRTGKVKYVCKTAIKYGRQCSCGQWSVTEEEVLPFVVQRLVKGLEKRAINEANMTPSGRPEQPSAIVNLQRKFAEIEKKLDRKRNGF